MQTKPHSISASGVILALFCTHPLTASAAVLYEQGLNNVITGHNPFTYTYAYDDFTLGTASTVTSIAVNAFTFLGSNDNIASFDWEIRSVNNTIPGGILFSGNNAVTMLDTGFNSGSWDLVDYRATIPGVALAAGSYFLGVKAVGAQNVHLTLLSQPVNISQALVSNGSGGYTDYWNGTDAAFRLEGVTGAPEPSAAILLGLGALGLSLQRRRNQA